MNAQSTLQCEARAKLKRYSASTAGAPARSNSIRYEVYGSSKGDINSEAGGEVLATPGHGFCFHAGSRSEDLVVAACGAEGDVVAKVDTLRTAGDRNCLMAAKCRSQNGL